jgi:hypothetical protein
VAYGLGELVDPVDEPVDDFPALRSISGPKKMGRYLAVPPHDPKL